MQADSLHSPNGAGAFEAHLEAAITGARTALIVAELLAYHFGYAPFGPVRRGKRLRPSIVMRVAASLGADDAAALDAASAIEILHNYSLVHDDIEDRDELRHGRPTLWARSGVAQALNAGDAMCALSLLTLLKAKERHPAVATLAMVEALHRAHAIMCDGQAMDLAFEESTLVGLADYKKMIAAKTGALFAAACVLGGHCGGAGPERIVELERLGYAYGEAFQIRDDVLGIWSDVESTGKTAGNDLARRKWTFPIVWALDQPESQARTTVAAAYSAGAALGADAVRAVTEALEALGAREAARESIAEAVSVVAGYPDADLARFLVDTLN